MKLFLFSVLLLVCFTLSAATPYELPRSSVIELEEKSSGRIYPVFIQLPASYAANTDQTYPIIYLTDAHYSFPIVSGAMRFPMNSGLMQHVIIVAVSYEKGSAGASSRIRDYTPTSAKAWKQQTGNAKAHMAFLRETVMPFIESQYRASKTDRTFVGNSLGGLFGAYILFTEPDLFSSYILGSPSVWFDDNAILNIPLTKAKTKIKVYLSVGEYETPAFGEGQDMVAGAMQLRDRITALSNAEMELNFVVVAGASHATAFPTTAIQGLDWLYGIKRK
ncbi:alpha/beta hydrolase [Rheinheimera nanhaiensis]|uniref:alpha/beta hydrolase n=1 Tax=Rheinheimera nanhaiensis TaxID=1163621 RepID=UPI0002F7001D|nr:alpha/beta hydrolase-fold protein [Rheinheimera nanhaiensis]